MSIELDGFYAAYLSGKHGQGLAILIFRRGRIVGADAGGVMYDGEYTAMLDGELSITVSLKSPPNTQMVQGGTASPKGDETELSFQMPSDFASKEFIRVDTPRGPVNVRFVRLRDIDE